MRENMDCIVTQHTWKTWSVLSRLRNLQLFFRRNPFLDPKFDNLADLPTLQSAFLIT
jgi:hypothetical protein